MNSAWSPKNGWVSFVAPTTAMTASTTRSNRDGARHHPGRSVRRGVRGELACRRVAGVAVSCRDGMTPLDLRATCPDRPRGAGHEAFGARRVSRVIRVGRRRRTPGIRVGARTGGASGADRGRPDPRGDAGVHIPDGYLSPATCGTFGAAMVPVWVTAGRRVRKVVKSRYVPLVAIGAAYSFLVMMFNVPIPDGTTAHAVGGVLVAVLLGPWAAVIAVSIALLIQALFFGDGGVLAYGANAFNMAIVMPFVGYAAALCAAVEFGLQPDLFHTADGTPLYAPFHLTQTIPAMLFAHLLVAGVVEAALTAGVITYLQRANRPVLQINQAMTPDWEVEE